MHGVGIGQLVFVFLLWILPIILVLKNKNTMTDRKAIWLLATLFFSWFGYLLFRLLYKQSTATNE